MSEGTARDKILDAAIELFSQKGSANTSIREICRCAGVGAPAVHYHFGNKDGLFEAVVEETLDTTDFQAQLVKAVRAAKHPEHMLRAYIETYLDHYPMQLCDIGLFVHDSMRLHEKSKQKTLEGLNGLYELAKEVIASGVSTGQYREVDVDTVAECILGMLDSFVSSRAYLGLPYDTKRVSDTLVDVLSRGLLKNGQKDQTGTGKEEPK